MKRIAICLAIICLSTSQPARGAEYLIGDPVNLGFPISSSQSDVGHLSRDGLSLYVSQGRNLGPARLNVAHRASLSDSWGPLDVMDGEINDGGSVGIASTTADELSVFFSGKIAHFSGSVRRGGLGRGDIWLSDRLSTDSSFGDPTNVGAPINTEYLESDPSISVDGLIMVFASNRPNGFGALDLWESRRASIDAPWQEPQNLGPHVNNSENHQTPTLSADGLTVMYSVAADGQWADLWAVTRNDKESPWNSPVNLGGKINTSLVEFNPQLSTDGSTLYYSQWTNSQEFDIFEVPLLPFETVLLSAGSEAYSQDFDEALSSDGKATGTILPTGWTSTDNGVIFENSTNKSFPAGSSLGRGTPIYNAGEDQHADRALAMGVTGLSDGTMLQLLADVTGQDATSVQLQFDMEVWDAAKRNVDLPGEPALDVTMEIDTGDGFTSLLDFGTVSTGDDLLPPAGDYLNGNADSNRLEFDSSQTDVDIPAGSTLRIRWAPNLDAQSTGWVYGLDNVQLSVFGDVANVPLRAGDADQDLDFDQLDLVQVQVANKYLMGEAATWGEGDWNGAPGGSPGNPPAGDGQFNQLDIIAAQQGAAYLTGPYTAIQATGQIGDGQTSVVYSPATGELSVDTPDGVELTSINIDSASGIFNGDAAQNLGGSFDNDADNNIFKATFGSSFGSLSFGSVAQAGLSEEFVLGDLTVVGSLAGGGDLGEVDLVYVPEPATAFLLAIGLALGLLHARRSHI